MEAHSRAVEALKLGRFTPELQWLILKQCHVVGAEEAVQRLEQWLVSGVMEVVF
jgi:hypothetical protein